MKEPVLKAMVMAAGLGKRMRPLTDTMPKPLVKVAGKPLLDHTLDWLAASGIGEVVVNSHYLSEQIEAHLKARRAPHISLSHEKNLLETGGGIKHALPLLGEKPFFVINSDIICLDGPSSALKRLNVFWDDAAMDVLLLLHPVARAVGYEGKGDFFLQEQGILQRRGDKAAAPLVFTGVQLLHPRLFARAPEGAFSLNLLYDQAMQAPSPRIRGLIHAGDWLHVGDPKGLAQAEAFLQNA